MKYFIPIAVLLFSVISYLVINNENIEPLTIRILDDNPNDATPPCSCIYDIDSTLTTGESGSSKDIAIDSRASAESCIKAGCAIGVATGGTHCTDKDPEGCSITKYALGFNILDDNEVKDASDKDEIVKNKIEQKMFENIPIKKPVIKKKDKFDPLKIAELIDKSKDTKTVEEDIEDLEYDALDSTPSLDNKLTLSEEDAIRAQFMQCWSIPIGIPFDDTMIVKIKISLNTDGSLLEPPEVLQHERMNKPSEKYFRTLAESALRAVRRCDPIKAPDINRYESWKKIQLNFDPREILRG